MADFSQRFEFIYKFFSKDAVARGYRASKLALAKYLTISQGKLQKWESGQVPQPDDLKLLHDTFGLSYAWLITGDGEPLDRQTNTEQVEAWRLEEIEKENYSLKARLEQTEAELREERSLNRQLTARLLVEGTTDKATAAAIAKAAGKK